MFKILDEVCTPKRGTKYSAAIDLYARENIVIGAGETAKVPLGVCLEYDKFPIYLKNNLDKFYLQLEPRSSLRAKGLIAGTGIIDLDYKDEIMIVLHNPIEAPRYLADASGIAFDMTSYEPFEISKGEKIAQILLKEHKTYLMGVDTEDERVGGLGSTGK